MKRGGPLRRQTRLTRSTRLRPRRKKREASVKPDPEYKDWVARQPCLLARCEDPCEGAVHPHHAGEELGANVKPPDDTCIPLCHRHHLWCWHAGAGPFKGWDKERQRDWSRMAITVTRRRARRAGVLEDGRGESDGE